MSDPLFSREHRKHANPDPSVAQGRRSMTAHEHRVVAADGTSIAYRVFMDGPSEASRPTLVLSNGIGCNDVFWKHQLHAFSGDYRMIAWDYRAHGASEIARSGDYSIATQADDLARVVADAMRGVEGPPPIHVGFSMGVCVLIALWERDPSLVRALALVKGPAKAPLSSRPPIGWPGGLAVTRATLRRLRPLVPILAPAARLGLRSPLTYWAGRLLGLLTKRSPREDVEDFIRALIRIDPLAFWDTVQALMAFDGRRILPSIRVPVQIIAGARDNLVTRSEIELMRRKIPGARAEIIEDAGHAGLLEAGPEIAEVLRRFFDRVQKPETEIH